jgi:hypothetical protein
MMNIEHTIRDVKGKQITVMAKGTVVINNAQDFLDTVFNLPSSVIVLHEENLHPDFFELRTGLAGDILQKVVNYKLQLGIVGDFKKYQSKSLRDFIYESNKTNIIVFTNTVDEAIARLSN